MEQKNNLLTSPAAILIGSVIIAIAILISSGAIPKISPNNNAKVAEAVPTQTQPTAQQPKQPTATIAQIKDVFNKSFIKFGDTNKKLIVIVVSDPSCPYCQVAAGQNPELNKQMGSQFILAADGGSYIAPVLEMEKLIKSGQAALAYLYSPGHGNGEMGAKAFYCAYDAGKFWEVHNLLMSSKGYDLLNNSVKNDKTKSGELAGFLQTAVNSSLMKQCLDSGKYDSKTKEETALAASIGISGTPGFYLNTTKYSGAYSYKDMEATVNSALK